MPVSVDERDSGRCQGWPLPGCRFSLYEARQRHRNNARYLARIMPVTETGRRLSLEQVPTEGLRYG
ncbi:hypothetical protein F7R12_30585 [Pseudomonas tolaasii]|nr:hypothetical protein B5P22_15075 [Pseudomonas tolaasii]KAB0465017.1 hypothetical protein F7R12_30585 [Pseudomonas tolaasii]